MLLYASSDVHETDFPNGTSGRKTEFYLSDNLIRMNGCRRVFDEGNVSCFRADVIRFVTWSADGVVVGGDGRESGAVENSRGRRVN